MKPLFLLLLAVLVAQPAFGQRTLGWYIGPTSAVTSVSGETGVLTGLEAGLIIREQFSVGLKGWRLLSDVRADRPDAEGNRYAEFFFSGISAAYLQPIAPGLSVAPGLLVGGAEAHWREGFFKGLVGDWRRDDDHTTSLVLAPGAHLNYTILPWLQATIGANYRFVTGGESDVLDQEGMRGFAGSVGLRFGGF